MPDTITVKTEVPLSRVADLLCAAIEGGMTGHWCRVMRTRKPRKPRMVMDAGRQDGRIWPLYDYPVSGGATVCRLDDGATEDTDRHYTPLMLDLAAIKRGLALMPARAPHQWAAFVAENEDAITGDVFVQLCLLGDVVYG